MLLSEMFGVERDVDFEVIGYTGRFILREWTDGTERLWWRLKGNKVYADAGLNVVYDIIFKAPDNIIHLPPPLTDEQREQLRAIWTLGGRWLTMGRNCLTATVHKNRPTKSEYCWIAFLNNSDERSEMLKGQPVSALVSWSDTEPYDIGKALGVTE